MHDDADISSRKVDHLVLCAEEEVEYRQKTTLLEEVELLHDSLPELSVDDVDTSLEVFGRQLQAPFLITGMTGGAPEAGAINRQLASVAQQLGLAFGVGSQRAMAVDDTLTQTYQVRQQAPDVLLFGNIGAVQAAQWSTTQVQDLVTRIEADALCVHLNPGQELIQPEGDRDFRGCLDAISRLVEELPCPVIVKETGCGLSYLALDKLHGTGVEWIDTSGAGGTTWIGVETLRANTSRRLLGEQFWEWGVPTAASIVYGKRRGMKVIGSGGLRDAHDAARAIALGATLAGMALPWLRAVHQGGQQDALDLGERLIEGLRTILTLTGSKNVRQLQSHPYLVGPRLRRWLDIDPGQASEVSANF